MQGETKKTIIRHLKGIVAALEKEEIPKVVTYRGVELKDCADEEILDAWEGTTHRSFWHLNNCISIEIAIRKEIHRRKLPLNTDR
ncbi:hypothetical protein KAR91_41975 [Candidatus Pacearchaeota archaeon]|nr:hypothetical protein [Candidatus Pacearchaeota archaeon]